MASGAGDKKQDENDQEKQTGEERDQSAAEGMPRWFDPFAANLDRLREQEWDLPQIELPGLWPAAWFRPPGADWAPAVDIEETDDAYVIDVDLPGVRRKNVNVEVQGQTVIITGERKEKERTGELKRNKRMVGSFRFEATLPGEFDQDAVDASLDRGVLVVSLPKTDAPPPQKIEIS